MALDQTPLRQKLAKAGTEGALDTRTSGLIGYVVNYHRQADTCSCKRHQGASIEKSTQHTVDIHVNQGNRVKEFHDVPCFVYSTGIIDKGLKENDRVWVQFINGDASTPIVTAYYREPSVESRFFRNLFYAVGDTFGLG
ncbi:hypothetical protein GZH47_32665 (plasmid) [Paenibacillus rhizovicinus]|uniref:Uncharacterized protein n=1 Tax=Paenibacillus rhizovicinus TaxID=2704463 RepID=A0A6C0PCI0_9BACL|nr:hypothetical protein [Paenibacillus rhizovicinus]QHW35653.1 hypothetical protein GZH47_32665 [Paenibacillus rhizovicinus]